MACDRDSWRFLIEAPLGRSLATEGRHEAFVWLGENLAPPSPRAAVKLRQYPSSRTTSAGSLRTTAANSATIGSSRGCESPAHLLTDRDWPAALVTVIRKVTSSGTPSRSAATTLA